MVSRVRPEPLNTTPRVSVVIPCYNYGHYLPTCVNSVLDQDGIDVDVLVIDDASPDGSAEVARRIAERDHRVRVIAHEVNKRHIATYNEGLAAVEGDYVVLLSADDLLAPGSLARATALMEHHSQVGLVYGFSPVFSDEVPKLRTTARSWSVWSGPEWIELVCGRGRNPVATPEVVMRASVMRELEGYDARMPHAADFFLWMRAAGIAAIGRVNGADQALYRVHGSNMHTDIADVVSDIAERRRTFEIFFAEDGATLPAAEVMLRAARTALAREALAAAVRSARFGTAPADVAAQLVALAEEIDPTVTRNRLRRADERQIRRLRERGRPSVLGRQVNAAADAVLSRVRWRQFRRDGVFGEGWSR